MCTTASLSPRLIPQPGYCEYSSDKHGVQVSL
jgi:hypothetical protein